MHDRDIHILRDERLPRLIVGYDKPVRLRHITPCCDRYFFVTNCAHAPQLLNATVLPSKSFGPRMPESPRTKYFMRCILERLAASGDHLDVRAACDCRDDERHHTGAEVDLSCAHQRNDLRRRDLADVLRTCTGVLEVAELVGEVDQVEGRVVGILEVRDVLFTG